MNKICEITLAFQKALIGEITPNIRAIYIKLAGNTINTIFFYNNKITDEDQENMSNITTEVIANFNDYFIDEKAIRIDYPKLFSLGSEYVLIYKPKEKILPNSTVINVSLKNIKLVDEPFAYEILKDN